MGLNPLFEFLALIVGNAFAASIALAPIVDKESRQLLSHDNRKYIIDAFRHPRSLIPYTTSLGTVAGGIAAYYLISGVDYGDKGISPYNFATAVGFIAPASVFYGTVTGAVAGVIGDRVVKLIRRSVSPSYRHRLEQEQSTPR